MADRMPRPRREDGAAAVEFALVLPILVTLIFGILQYGLWFNDSLSTRQGVREGARLGVVGCFTGASCPVADLPSLASTTRDLISAPTGEEYVRVRAATWTRGRPLVVCAWVKSEGGVGLLPMPNGGWIFSRTEMSIEKATPVPATLSGSSGALPAGAPAWPAGC